MRTLALVTAILFLFAANVVAGEKEKVKNSPKKSTGVIQEPLKEQEPDRPRSTLSITAKVENKKAMGGRTTKELVVSVKGKMAEGQFPLMMRKPDGKEVQIALVERSKMKDGAFTVDRPISRLGQYKITLKDQGGKVLATREKLVDH